MRAALVFFSTLVLSLAAGLGGYSFYQNWNDDGATRSGDLTSNAASAPRRSTESRSALIGSRRADFSLNDLHGQQRSISEWNGQVLLINFWATWCPPCRREIPVLSALHREFSASGFSVLGVAMDDVGKVSDYVKEYDVPYPNLTGSYDVAKVAAKLGNGAGSLPYTVIVDRDGIIRYVHLGEISRDMALAQIRPLLDRKTATAAN